MAKKKLNQSEYTRYNRQLILSEIGHAGQLKIKAAKVLVIGAGGLGCPILMYLTAAGIGSLGVVDYDNVDLSNLHRQVLYTNTDIGKNKAEVACSKLKKQNPEIDLIPYPFKLDKNNILNVISKYDIVVDGSDNFPTRYLVSDACELLEKTLVFGAVHQFLGQASVFNYKNGPTYRCLFPEQPGVGEASSCATAGVLGVLPGIVGGIQANETLKIILEIGESLSGKLWQINALDNQVEIIPFSKDSKRVKITALGEYEIACDWNVKELNSTDFKTNHNLNDFSIIDLRPSHQFELFNIGGINLSREEIIDDINLIKTSKKILFICQIGEQSAEIANFVQTKIASIEVYSLAGGINSWNNK